MLDTTSNYSDATSSITSMFQVDQIIKSLSIVAKKNICLSINGLSHRVKYLQLPSKWKARARLLSNTTTVTLYDIPIWTLNIGDVLVNSKLKNNSHPTTLAKVPSSIRTVLEAIFSSVSPSSRTTFLVSTFVLKCIPVSISLLKTEGNNWHFIFATAIGTLVYCLLPMQTSSEELALPEVLVACNISAYSVSRSQLFYLQGGNLYSISLTDIYGIKTGSWPRSIKVHGIDSLTHISAVQEDVYALSASGAIYTCSTGMLTRLFGLHNENIVSFVVSFEKKATFAILYQTMTLQIYNDCGNLTKSFGAVLHIQQTTEKRGIVCLLRRSIVLIYRGCFYVIPLLESSNYVNVDLYTTRLLSSAIVGSKILIVVAYGSGYLKLDAILSKSPGSKMHTKPLLSQRALSAQLIELKPNYKHLDSIFPNGYTLVSSACEFASGSLYSILKEDNFTESNSSELTSCIFTNACSNPSLCSLCRRIHSAVKDRSLLPESFSFRLYISMLTEAGKYLDYKLATQTMQVTNTDDTVLSEMIKYVSHNSGTLIPYFMEFKLNLLHFEVLVRTGLSKLTVYAGLALLQRYGSSAPWLTALIYKDIDMPSRYFQSLTLLFTLNLQCSVLPYLTLP